MPRVLLVNAHAAFRAALREYFERGGFGVECTGDPAEAERRLRDGDFAAAVIDVGLSGPKGREGLALLEVSRRASPRTRAVLLATEPGYPDRAEALRLGAAAVLLKPVPLGELLAAVAG